MTEKMVLLRSEAKQLRNGKVINRGERFTATEAEAADLVALHFASLIADEDEAQVAQLEAALEPRPKRRYRRRDMRAEQ